MKEIKLLIPDAKNRADIVIALANSGYNVRTEKERLDTYSVCNTRFWVIFTDKENLSQSNDQTN